MSSTDFLQANTDNMCANAYFFRVLKTTIIPEYSNIMIGRLKNYVMLNIAFKYQSDRK
jgi:hypothetical protein